MSILERSRTVSTQNVMRMLNAISPAILTICTTGFVSTIAQIIVLRELLVLFYGNELSAGLIFAGWLLWSGTGSAVSAKLAARCSVTASTLGTMLVFLASLLPVTVLLIRASRIIWALPVGELPGIGRMMGISITSTALFCMVSGSLFGVCWAFQGRKKQGSQPLWIYLGEAFGAAGGGICFYYIFIPYFSAMMSIWVISAIALAMAAWLCRPWRFPSKSSIIWITAGLCLAIGMLSGNRVQRISRQWQWGSKLVAVFDTAYHNIAVVRKGNQVSIFTNGLWNFSDPDRLSAEYGVHLALLQHPAPQTVLILGGGIAGLLTEVFKHPAVRHIDYVEPDPDFIQLISPYLSPETRKTLHHPYVNVVHIDPRIFLRSSTAAYDVILMNAGDPITAQMNRFYTREFFKQVKQRLSAGGVFSFAVSGGESMLGPAQARFLGSIRKTLVQIFPNTLIYPGDQTRFFASDRSETLSSDVELLANRIYERNLRLTFITESMLQDALSPFRLDYFQSILEQIQATLINKDFYPICYFHNLMMWATQWHPFLQKLLQTLADLRIVWVWSVLILLEGMVVLIFWTGSSKYQAAVSATIIISGAIEIVIQIVLVLAFQIIEGFVYRQLALIIAFFMTGLAVGAGIVSGRSTLWSDLRTVRKSFLHIQVLVCVLPVFLALFLVLPWTVITSILSSAIIGWIFCCISFVSGFLGGVHFGLAVLVTSAVGRSSERIGGILYALDLAGAAMGALIASFLVLPIFGIIHTLSFLAALAGVGLVLILRSP